jgi:hypothetical protein
MAQVTCSARSPTEISESSCRMSTSSSTAPANFRVVGLLNDHERTGEEFAAFADGGGVTVVGATPSERTARRARPGRGGGASGRSQSGPAARTSPEALARSATGVNIVVGAAHYRGPRIAIASTRAALMISRNFARTAMVAAVMSAFRRRLSSCPGWLEWTARPSTEFSSRIPNARLCR